MVRGHHRLNGYEFEQTLKTEEEKRSLACYNPWGLKESDTTQQLKTTYRKNYVRWTKDGLI